MRPESEIVSLSGLLGKVKDVLDGEFSSRNFWVKGEVINFKKYDDRQMAFFELVEKDEESNEVRACCNGRIWSYAYPLLQKFEEETSRKFEDDIEVLVNVRIEYHIRYGINLRINDIDPGYTLGKIARDKERILSWLVEKNSQIYLKEGIYYTPNKGLRLPPVIQNIAVITSTGAAGFHDFMHELRMNGFGFRYKIDIYKTSVQGRAAAGEMVDCLIRIFRSKKEYDAVLMVRGGGSAIDFDAFNEYKLALAVAKFPRPVITGIGHEENTSICDLMANTHTRTPTKAAGFINERNAVFLGNMQFAVERMYKNSGHILKSAMRDFSEVKSRFINKTKGYLHAEKLRVNDRKYSLLSGTGKILQTEREDLVETRHLFAGKVFESLKKENKELARTSFALEANTRAMIREHWNVLEKLSLSLKLSDPRRLLEKGFVMAKKDGKIIKTIAQLSVGDKFNLAFRDGEVVSEVQKIKNNNG